MKTCKKILAGILVFAMMMSVCAFVSADVAETTKVLLWANDFNDLTATTLSNGNNVTNNAIDAAISTQKFYLKTGGKTSGTFNADVSKTNVITDSTDSNNKYISTTHTQLGYNVNLKSTDFPTYGYGESSIYSISYDVMIPNDDTYKTNRRYAYVDIGTTDTTAEKDYEKIATRVIVNIYNGTIKARGHLGTASTSYITQKSQKDITYNYGDWVTIRINSWLDGNKICVAVYADDELIYEGERAGDDTVTLAMASSAIEFRYANVKSNGTSIYTGASTSTDSSVYAESVTCYDNIEASLINEVVDDSKTPQVTLHSYTADAVSAYLGGAGTNVFIDAGELNKNVVQGSATDDPVKEAFQVVDKSYTNITSSSYKYLVVNSYGSFAKYVQKDAKNTFVYSMDLNFKDFNAEMKNTLSFGIEGQKKNDIQGSFTVGTDGSIGFSHATANNGSAVEGKLRTESRTVPAGEWINVKMVFEINYGETQYAIKMFGIYEDAVIYENEFTLTHNETTDGKGICVDMITFNIGKNDTTHTETVTGVNDIYFEKNNNFNWSAVDTDNWIDRKVSLTLDADGNVDVEAKKGGDETFTSGVLVVALYGESGTLIDKILTSTDITDGKFVYEVPVAKVATAKKIKAFVFDTITTAVPQMKHGEIVVGTGND